MSETASPLRATASALHRFNRYEIKYLIDVRALPALRADLERRMVRDELQRTPTRLTSLYYDTRDLRFYWEKVDGLRFRRKLRVRVYGPPEKVSEASTVFVEIKQRVDRVTQKRRVALSYPSARMLCDERRDPGVVGAAEPLVAEILGLVQTLDLQPTVITTYFRDGYVGQDADLGLRITVDQRVSGRDRDFYLGATGEDRFIVPPTMAVLEVKANERVPKWFTDLAARHDLTTVRISKYCRTIEAYERGIRAPLHVRELPRPTPKDPA
jgi:SPX domain protein involved in polyphosphate accumulation